MSFAPPKTCIDLENDTLYSADAGVGLVAGIRLDQVTGELTTRVRRRDHDAHVSAADRAEGRARRRAHEHEGRLPLMNALLEVASGKYKEHVTWREAATGRLLAESDLFEPLTFNSLIVPGYGRRMYYPTDSGFITLQVRPAAR
jgi:hypothetical protein